MKAYIIIFMALMTSIGISSCEAKSSKDALPTEKMQKSLDDPSIRIDMHLKCIYLYRSLCTTRIYAI